MRPFATVLGFATVTAVTTFIVGWSPQTFADPPETFFGAGTVDAVTFSGEIAHDASFKTGWAIKVTYENGGDDDETAVFDAELARSQVSPASRASAPGVAVWHHRDKVTVPAHETVERVYDVPQWVAAQLSSNDKAMQIRQKKIERESEKPEPNFALSMRPYTLYSVAFQKLDG
jgi:hypothetical protein